MSTTRSPAKSRHRNLIPLALGGVAAVAAILFSLPPSAKATAAAVVAANGAKPAPEFKGISNWFNAAPMTMESLRGKVVLVDFWTFTCSNCLNQLPHVQALHEKYKDQGLVVIGVHSPEYEEERSTEGLKAAIARLGIKHAVAQDNDFATWRAYNNRFWPAEYLIDKQGRVVYSHFGEGAYEQTDAAIQALLKQPG